MPRLNDESGVKYGQMKTFKRAMQAVSARTIHLCERKKVYVVPGFNSHGGTYEYRGNNRHRWVATLEGIGNKPWIAALLNHFGLKDPAENYFFGGLGLDAFRMASNDCAAHGGDSVVAEDEVTCGDGAFFDSPEALVLAESFDKACFASGCALIQGESAPYTSLMRADPPVKFAPSFSVAVTGICDPAENYVSGEDVRTSDVIIGVSSSGLQANGISPLKKCVLAQPKGFLTPLNGHTVGEEALIPTMSYVGLVCALAKSRVPVQAYVPITGDGIAKLGRDHRFHYKIHSWPNEDKIPPLFRWLLSVGIPLSEMLQTFNYGIGYVAIVPPKAVAQTIEVANKTQIDGESGFYEAMEIGVVEWGKPTVYFAPANLTLPPPGE